MLVQHVVVVETVTKLNLLIVGVDILTESFRRAEVERCALDLQNLTRRNSGVVGWKVEVGIDLADLVVNCRGGVGGTSQ